jgi:hypothetical protein
MAAGLLHGSLPGGDVTPLHRCIQMRIQLQFAIRRLCLKYRTMTAESFGSFQCLYVQGAGDGTMDASDVATTDEKAADGA